MYSLLFIGKGTITSSLARSLGNAHWRVDHHRRNGKDLSTIDISKYDYVVSCLPDAEIAEKIWHDILASALNSNARRTTFVDISTLTCETTIKINGAFCREKLIFIEAPFTGSKTGASTRNVIYFAYSERAAPENDIFLRYTSSKIYTFKTIGAATQFKLFYNLWGLTSLGLLGQMLQIINCLPQKDLVAEIITSNDDFWMGAVAKQKLHQSLCRAYDDIHCKLKYAKKDMQYAMDEFGDYKLDLSRCLLSILEENKSQQYADLDFTSMCEFFR